MKVNKGCCVKSEGLGLIFWFRWFYDQGHDYSFWLRVDFWGQVVFRNQGEISKDQSNFSTMSVSFLRCRWCFLIYRCHFFVIEGLFDDQEERDFRGQGAIFWSRSRLFTIAVIFFMISTSTFKFFAKLFVILVLRIDLFLTFSFRSSPTPLK